MSDLTGQHMDRYKILEPLGKGGMAMVYKAYDTRLEREVAIKVIRQDAFPPDALQDVLKRFEREAKSLARLSHPNIVKVMDYGDFEGSPFLVMEYHPRGTLKQNVSNSIAWWEAVRMILPVARGIEYAHLRGIVHRDIKPANILITESGEPTLSDFGIAKIFEGDNVTALTASGMAIGTPEYMAPEQWTGGTGPQSDIYSLGVVLYEMITGTKPFSAETPAGILLKQATEPLTSPAKFSVNLSDEIVKFLFKALAKAPQERHATMTEFISELEGLLITPEAQARRSIQKEVVTDQTMLPESKKIPMESQSIGEAPIRDLGKAAVVSNRSSRMRIGIAGVLGVLILGTGIVLSQFKGQLFAGAPMETAMPTATRAFTFTATIDTATATETHTPPPTLPAEIVDAQNVTMLVVPAGEFTMGNNLAENMEQPAHKVYLASFYIDKYEVTNALYKLCVDVKVCLPPKLVKSFTHSRYYGNSTYDNYPVIFVDWDRAKTFCEWRGARLPTEAEWEKAARGDDERYYPWGNTFDGTLLNSCDKNCKQEGADKSINDGYEDTAPVGSYPGGASPYGVYDMAGNVWEWTADWMSETYYASSPSSNPSGPVTGVARVVRGGSWRINLTGVRTFHRDADTPDTTLIVIGFRCAKDAP